MKKTFSSLALLIFLIVAPAFAQKTGLEHLPDFQSQWTAADLAPLREIIGEAHWVGLGESIHTTEGFSQAKFRIVRYMVEEMGFRALAFESGTGWRDASKASQYVETCQGSVNNALDGLAMTWRGQSVADLLQWLCSYNQKHPADPVKFFSFDIQFQSEKDLTAIESGLKTVAPKSSKALMTGLSTCFGYGMDELTYKETLKTKGATTSDEDAQKCNAGLDRLDNFIALHINGTKRRAWKWLRVASVGVRGFENLVYQKGRDQPRDLAMATQIDYIHELLAPRAKTIIWAHSTHLSQNGSAIQGASCLPNLTPWDGSPTMGEVFTRKHGSDYLPIALTGYEISAFDYSQPNPWPIAHLPLPAGPNSIELKLHDIGAQNWILDLNGDFLVQDQAYTVQDTGCQDAMIPSKQFRALISLEKVEAMQTPR